MDYPFLVIFIVLVGAVWVVAATLERFRDWPKAFATLATVVLIVESLWLIFQ